MASIKEIAGKCKVSYTTVSRILGDTPGFSYAEATRKKVLSTAKRLGYVPNPAAQIMRMKKTNLVGIAVQSHNSYFSFRMQEKLSMAVRQLGYSPTLIDFSDEALATDSKIMGRVDILCGIICLYVNQEAKALKIANGLAKEMPIVTMFRKKSSSLRVRSVHTDHHRAMLEIVAYLASLGHKNICFHGHTPMEPKKDEKLSGYFLGLEKSGIDGICVTVKSEMAGNSFKVGFETAEQLVRKHCVTAAVCEDDEFAAGLAAGLHSLGVGVPGDFSVVGYDDLPFAAYSNPRLTTMRQDVDALSRRAAELLVSSVDASDVQKRLLPQAITVNAELVVRDSTGPATSGGGKERKNDK